MWSSNRSKRGDLLLFILLIVIFSVKGTGGFIGRILATIGFLLALIFVIPLRLCHSAKRKAWSFLGWDQLHKGGRPRGS